MAHDDKPGVDQVTGRETTGHEWDGIRELNTPLPRWWLWTLYATIVWAVGYWIFYPAWPLVTSYTTGVSGWMTRTAVEDSIAELHAIRGETGKKIISAGLSEIENTPDLLSYARAQGKAAFATNCATCHGSGASGAVGYPNLNDDDWLWGGTLDQIATTIRHGVRSADQKAHSGVMLPFGRTGMLQRPQVDLVVDYVRSLSGLEVRAGSDLPAGAAIFKQNCASCHGDDGKGKRDTGAPNLTDVIWLYGSSREDVFQSVWNGRGGVMPNWQGRLDEATIKSLAVYVHTLGGGE
ncbi:cytochrome-c oxidase, cbb3-type subunit III [Terrihabitans soli]|nr:cytochrome-c oxidase, cbb3-type subunit III [Terrihabitans soli]